MTTSHTTLLLSSLQFPAFTTQHSLLLFHSPPPSPSRPLLSLKQATSTYVRPLTPSRRNPFVARTDDGDAEGGGPDDYDMDEEELEEIDNKEDFDIEYEPLATGSGVDGGDGDIAMVQSTSFVPTQGWDSEVVVDYRINEDEFHKISLLDCDFFIRKPPDPDNDVYDFREVSSGFSLF
jgi:hypothetical protein